MGNLTVPIKNAIEFEKKESQIYLEHRDSVFAYLDKLKSESGQMQFRVTPQDIIANTDAEKLWEASTLYKDWLRNSGKEKLS
tara:strand:+ start:54 stop:299 length:246 start_codon:yes stop_codon:yes gene_type:complete